MARDYAKQSKRPAAKAKVSRDPFAKLWYLTAFAIIAFVACLLYLKHNEKKLSQNLSKAQIKKIAHAAKPVVAEVKPEKPRFEFYTMLPNAHPPEKAKPELAKTEPPKTEPPKTEPVKTLAAKSVIAKSDNARFVLQIAAFKKMSDADQVRIDLTLKGFNVALQKIKSHNEIWTRVQVGPFATETEAELMKKKLSQANYQSVIRRVS